MVTQWAPRSGCCRNEDERQDLASHGSCGHLSSVGKREQRSSFHSHLTILPQSFSVSRTHFVPDLFIKQAANRLTDILDID